MGRGGYLGGSTVIHPGSSWFGRGKPKSKVKSKQLQEALDDKSRRKAKKVQSAKKAQQINSVADAKERGLTRAEWVAKAARRMETAEADVLAARIKLRKVEAKLADARAAHLKAVRGSARTSAQKTDVTA